MTHAAERPLPRAAPFAWLARRLPALLWLAAALQVVLLARAAWSGLAWELECRRVLAAQERIPIPPHRSLAAYRDLNRIAAALPLDASVLLVDSSPQPLQYAFYFRPRPFLSLLVASRADVELVRSVRPDLAVHFERRVERFEERDRLFTDERLAAELARHDFLVFYPLEVPVAVAGVRLELVAREGWASLFRIATGVPGEGSGGDGSGGEW